MPYVIRLAGYTPSARDDDQPWTRARIEESTLETGPWTELETVALDPVDTDPLHPLTRNFTSEVATLPSGWYQVTFLDDDGEEQPTEPVFNGPTFRPPVAEVAALMLDRTTLEGGHSAGTFNENTTPTGAQVEQVIGVAMDSLDPLVPSDARIEVIRAARSAAAITAAILVETTMFADQVEVNAARIEAWDTLLQRHLVVLDDAARDNTPGGTRAYGVPIGTVTAGSWLLTTDLLP